MNQFRPSSLQSRALSLLDRNTLRLVTNLESKKIIVIVQEERDASGKLLNYNCKLCDCKFSDPNAKEIHLKGRRHRMQYKLKVSRG